ncbi:MAG: DNA-3-methyladenine glycosylase 2 family protein [Chlorobia bacterium]|nr:DNA-3-methyladenine glycosylase 2 family protein [Fimbriimonadaceae bacterium]
MKLTREEMLATLGSRDPAHNGKFIIGVLSTGIYCLPSCHARTPKPENVHFFENGVAAEAAGLRPCKKCRPDEFERGENQELDSLEGLVASMRRDPAAYACVPDLADALSVGPTKLHELFRIHYHATPGEMLSQARLDKAKHRLLSTDEGIAQTAYEVGFESLSVFNDNFKRRLGLTPSEYRSLPAAEEFAVQLPSGYHIEGFARSFGRDPQSPTERLDNRSACLVTPNKALVSFELGDPVRVRTAKGSGVDAYETLYRVLGLSQEPKAFEQIAVEKGFHRLVEDRSGTRIPQTLSLFDGLVWAIVGQQINLPFAFALRRRLFEKYGEPAGNGLYATPTPERLADLDPEDLLLLQFSRRKAEYVTGVARLGWEWLQALEGMSFTRAYVKLTQTHGLGVWSANYILMRSLGFPDCVPYGDTGLSSGLVGLYDLAHKPDRKEIERLMEPFSPYRSFATYHLWQSMK